MSKYKTRPIGEIFKFCNLKLQVVENNSCDECYFMVDVGCINYLSNTGECGESMRNDRKNVIFKRIFE